MLKPIERRAQAFKSLADVFERALEQEQEVSRQIDSLYEIAFTEKAFAAVAELQWFLTEQVEEEKTGREIVAKLQDGRRRSGVAARPRSRARQPLGVGAADCGHVASSRERARYESYGSTTHPDSSASAGCRACMRSDAPDQADDRPARQPRRRRRSRWRRRCRRSSRTAILEHIKVLVVRRVRRARARHQGRGADRRVPRRQFKKLGLKPGNPDGTYVQKVPLVGITGTQAKPLTITKGAHEADVQVARRSGRVDEARRRQRRRSTTPRSSSPATASRRRSSTGTTSRTSTSRARRSSCSSTIPPVPDPADPSKLDPKTFGGKAMTYYGRWTYKFEEGARKGAAGMLIVHETGPPAIRSRSCRATCSEKFDLVTPDKNMGRAAIEGWITLDAAKKILAMAGQDFDALKKQAATREFKPVPLGLKASLAIQQHAAHDRLAERRREARRQRPALKDEYVVYSAHWDHLGVGAAGQRRHDLQRRARQRVRRRDRARDRARVHAGAAGAEALDPVPDGHRRGAGAARLAVLLGHPALSARQDGRQHQHRRRQPVGTHEGHHRRSASARPTSTTTCKAAAAEQGRTLTPGSRAGEGLLLPLGSLQLREAGRAGARSGLRHRVRRQAARLRQEEARRVHGERLPRAVRRDEAGLGSDRRRQRMPSCSSPSATASRTRTSSRSGSRATSSRRSGSNAEEV